MFTKLLCQTTAAAVLFHCIRRLAVWICRRRRMCALMHRLEIELELRQFKKAILTQLSHHTRVCRRMKDHSGSTKFLLSRSDPHIVSGDVPYLDLPETEQRSNYISRELAANSILLGRIENSLVAILSSYNRGEALSASYINSVEAVADSMMDPQLEKSCCDLFVSTLHLGNPPGSKKFREMAARLKAKDAIDVSHGNAGVTWQTKNRRLDGLFLDQLMKLSEHTIP